MFFLFVMAKSAIVAESHVITAIIGHCMSPRGRHYGRCLIVHFDDVADHRIGLRISGAAADLHILVVCVRRIAYLANIDVGHFARIVREMQFDFFEGAIFRFRQQEVNGEESVRILNDF